MFICLSVPEDLANRRTDVVLLHSVGSHISWRGLQLCWVRYQHPTKRNRILAFQRPPWGVAASIYKDILKKHYDCLCVCTEPICLSLNSKSYMSFENFNLLRSPFCKLSLNAFSDAAASKLMSISYKLLKKGADSPVRHSVLG